MLQPPTRLAVVAYCDENTHFISILSILQLVHHGIETDIVSLFSSFAVYTSHERFVLDIDPSRRFIKVQHITLTYHTIPHREQRLDNSDNNSMEATCD